MKIALMLTTAALGAVFASDAAGAAPVCGPGSVDLARAVDVIEAVRLFKGADGQSQVETIKLQGKKGVYYGGKVRLNQFDLGDPTGVSLVYGEPGMDIPVHPAPYREIFIVLSGSSEIVLANGKVHALKPGSMVIAEDLGTPGRSGRAGPCGYVAIDLQFKTVAPAPPSP